MGRNPFLTFTNLARGFQSSINASLLSESLVKGDSVSAIFVISGPQSPCSKALVLVKPQRRRAIDPSFKTNFRAAAAAGMPLAGREKPSPQAPSKRVATDGEGIEPAVPGTASILKDRSADDLGLGRLEEEDGLAPGNNGVRDGPDRQPVVGKGLVLQLLQRSNVVPGGETQAVAITLSRRMCHVRFPQPLLEWKTSLTRRQKIEGSTSTSGF
jgi:hypothetical protein